MQVKLTPSRDFDVSTSNGKAERFYQVGKEWNGMMELRDEKGRAIIVTRITPKATEIISEIFGDGSTEWVLVKGAPEIYGLLKGANT